MNYSSFEPVFGAHTLFLRLKALTELRDKKYGEYKTKKIWQTTKQIFPRNLKNHENKQSDAVSFAPDGQTTLLH